VSLFVTFEGIEGSGKSTHLQALAAHLRARGHAVVETREPGGTPAGEAIRRLLLATDPLPLTPAAELFLYCADRAQHIAEVVRPALAAGRIVLCDRFTDSTIAYQGYGRGLDLGALRALDAHARDGVWPDLTLLLDCPVAEGLARARGRAYTLDRFEAETTAFHERVREGFQTLAAAEHGRFCVIDARHPIAQVERQVVAAVERRLEKR
jgi:dTMP kinase